MEKQTLKRTVSEILWITLIYLVAMVGLASLIGALLGCGPGASEVMEDPPSVKVPSEGEAFIYNVSVTTPHPPTAPVRPTAPLAPCRETLVDTTQGAVWVCR